MGEANLKGEKKMLKRVLTFALIGLLGGSLFTGCGNSAGKKVGGKKRKQVYVIVKTSESEFWQIVLDGAKTAGEELDVELKCQAPVAESDTSKQIAILESATAAKPDAIVIAPSSADPLVPGIEKAVERNIPVIVIDSKANTDKITSFLASDNYQIGVLSADEMAKALTAKTGKPEGDIACVTYLSGAGSLEKRKAGFLDALKKKYPKINVVAFQDANGKSGATTSIVQNYLTAYPNLKGIYASNQNTGDETVRALDNAKKKGLAVVVVDAGPQEVWGLDNGFVDAMIVQKPWHMGYMGVQYAIKAANGEKLEKFIDTGIVAITPEMKKSGEAEEFLDPVNFRKKQKAAGK
jgi:ribose transport system substrate-binding protein